METNAYNKIFLKIVDGATKKKAKEYINLFECIVDLAEFLLDTTSSDRSRINIFVHDYNNEVDGFVLNKKLSYISKPRELKIYNHPVEDGDTKLMDISFSHTMKWFYYSFVIFDISNYYKNVILRNKHSETYVAIRSMNDSVHYCTDLEVITSLDIKKIQKPAIQTTYTIILGTNIEISFEHKILQ
jgi:hypothetical protein